MSWHAFEIPTTVLALILGLAGFFTFFYNRALRAWELDIGKICRNDREMKYFVVKSPGWWPWPSGVDWNPTKPPLVPSIGSLIRAGDNIRFSSAAFDLMKPSHNSVAWVDP